MVLRFVNGEFDVNIGDVFTCDGRHAGGVIESISADTQYAWVVTSFNVSDPFNIVATPAANFNKFSGYLHASREDGKRRYYNFKTAYLNYLGRNEDHVLPCFYCGQIHKDSIIIDGRAICPNCLEEHTFVCIECGETHDTRRRMKGISLCRPLLEAHPGKYARARNDGKVYPVSSLLQSEDGHYFTAAAFALYTRKCSTCGKVLVVDNMENIDGEYYCSDCADEIRPICYHCGRRHNPDTMVTVDGLRFCKDCLSRFYNKCCFCGRYHESHRSRLTRDTSEPVCPECAKAHKCVVCGAIYKNDRNHISNATVWIDIDEGNKRYETGVLCNECLHFYVEKCADCGDYVRNNLGNMCPDGKYYCGNHIGNHFVRCSYCEEWIEMDRKFYGDTDSRICEACYLDSEHGTSFGEDGRTYSYDAPEGIQDYYYKPDPIFYPSKDTNGLYMGVELEVDDGHDAEEAVDVANSYFGITYGKHDGSLGREGIEFVSHPATIDWFMDHKDEWRRGMEYLHNEGYSSHDSNTCGLHVHVSAFPLLYETQYGIEKLLYFQDKFWDNLFAFSRRDEGTANDWARRIPVGDEIVRGILDSGKEAEHIRNMKNKSKASNRARYQCINLQNKHTVEFRIFRGTLNIDPFIATLQLVSNLCELACEKTFDEFKKLDWMDVVNYHEYPELTAYWNNAAYGFGGDRFVASEVMRAA